jgi:hypothetical protein
MNHFDEVPGTGGATIEVAVLGSKSFENGFKMLVDASLSTHHHAITNLESPDAAAYSHIHELDCLRSQHLCPANVIFVVGVAPIDNNVTRGEQLQELAQMVINRFRGAVNLSTSSVSEKLPIAPSLTISSVLVGVRL